MNPGSNPVRRILEFCLSEMRSYEGLETILSATSVERNGYLAIDVRRLL